MNYFKDQKMKLLLLLALSCQFVWAKDLKVKFGTVAPAGTPWAQTLEDIRERVDKNSKGKIQIKTYLHLK